MYDILKDLITYIPGYLNELLKLLIGPKKHINQSIDTDANLAWENSLRFAFISFLLIFLLKWLALTDVRDVQQIIVGEGVLTIFEFAMSGLLLLIVWRLLGVKRKPRDVLTVFAFILGVWILIEGIFLLTQLGAVKMLDPNMYALLNGMNQVGNVQEIQVLAETYQQSIVQPEDAQLREATLNLLNILNYIGAFILLIWLLICWPVYGGLFNIGRGKVFTSLVIFLIVNELNPMSFIKIFVMMAWT